MSELTTLEERQKLLRRPLKNKNCPYCGRVLDGSVKVTKDHVVARGFVPRGKLYQSQNVFLRCCLPCNVEKSELEDDLSALSMLPDLLGKYPHNDVAIAERAREKAKQSYSRRTKKPILESSETLVATSSFGPGSSITASFTSPPQLDEDRAFELARLQMQGFFFALTYNAEQQMGGFWLGGFYPLIMSARADWGNAVQRWFMRTVLNWQSRVVGSLADGFFKIAIRRHPSDVLWSWALEWNQNIRMLGFLGEEAAVMSVAAARPMLQVFPIGSSPDGGELRMREEIALPEEEDELFVDLGVPAA